MSNESALQQRVEALETRLRHVEAVQAIQQLKARYGAVTDRRYAKGTTAQQLSSIADEVAAMFSEDGVWDGGPKLGVCRGRAAIRERFLKPTLDFAMHFFVKPQLQISVDGDTAQGTWDILAPCTTPDGRAWWMAGVEHDEYVRVEGEWLHSSMRLDLVFMAPYQRGWARSER